MRILVFRRISLAAVGLLGMLPCDSTMAHGQSIPAAGKTSAKATAPTAAKDPMTLEEYRVPVFHGRPGETRFVNMNGHVATIMGAPAPTHFSGNRALMCFDVLNAAPALYTYSRTVRVDTVAAQVPDLSQIIAALSAFASRDSQSETKAKLDKNAPLSLRPAQPSEARDSRDTAPDWKSKYGGKLLDLAHSVKIATTHIEAASQPEDLERLMLPGEDRKVGFAYAQTMLRAMSDTTGGFRDPKLSETVAKWATAYAVPTTPKPERIDSLVHASFVALGQSLVKEVDRIKTTYMNVSHTVSVCDTVRAERTEIRLSIQPRDPKLADRDTGAARLVLINEAPFDVPFITLDPMLLFSGTHEASEVTADGNGTVTTALNQRVTRWRPASVLSLNFSPIGRYAGFVASPFGGFGFGQDGKGPISDVLVGASFGFRDSFRIGGGWGYSSFIVGTNADKIENGKLKAGTKLNDALRSDWVSSAHIVLSFKGVTLSSKASQ